MPAIPGHGDAVKQGALAGALAFELADGLIHLPNLKAALQLLNKETCPRLECVYLNGCNTLDPLGLAIQRELPHLTVIGWNSKAADQAANVFSTGFYDALGKAVEADAQASESLWAMCYGAAAQKFEEKGFIWGDPEKKDPKTGKRPHGAFGILTKQQKVAREFASKLLTRRQSSGAQTSEEEAPGTSPSGNKPPKTLHVDGPPTSQDEDSDAVAALMRRRRICWLNPAAVAAELGAGEQPEAEGVRFGSCEEGRSAKRFIDLKHTSSD